MIKSARSLLVGMFCIASTGESGTTVDYRQRVEDAFISGLVGDSLALGGHYEYDAAKIKRVHGEYTTLQAPGQGFGGQTHGVGWGSANYHPGKKAGDLTDAGEIAIMLLEYLNVDKQYSFDGYASYWKRQIDEGYGSCNFRTVGPDANGCPAGLKPGYLNGATVRTLDMLKRFPSAKGTDRINLAANTNCIVAATHFLPLFLTMTDEQQLVDAAISTVYLSHRHHDPVAATEFLTRSLFGIIHRGMTLEDAFDDAAVVTNDAFITQKLAVAKAKVLEALDTTSQLYQQEFVDDIAVTSMARLWEVGKSEPIKVGKASPVEGALPASIYLALKYKDSLPQALIANAGIGGDSAARGMVIGMLLGAVHGKDLPDHWLNGLNSRPHVEALFQQIRSKNQDYDEL